MYKKFLIATDGSPLAESAARGAIELAKACGASVVGFFAAPTYNLPIYNDMSITPVIEPEKFFIKHNAEMAKQYLGALEALANTVGVAYIGRTSGSDQPALAIIKAAKNEGCDLICMGSHGHGSVAQMLLGSVATKVMALCDIPVLLHRTHRAA
jgi:nucleotide-binding universal stress UspA family protein